MSEESGSGGKKSLIDISILSPEVQSEVYKDLVKTSTQNLGSVFGALTGILKSVTYRVQYWNEKQRLMYENNIKKLEEGLSKIEDEKRIEIPLELAVSIIEKLSYTSNPNISEMYLNLLLKGASQDTVTLAHPSFVNSVGCLSYDEAVLLKVIYEKSMKVVPAVDFLVYSTNGDNTKSVVSEDSYTAFPIITKLDYPDNETLYIHNLVGLGIFNKMEERVDQLHVKLYDILEDYLKEEQQEFFESVRKEQNLDDSYEVRFVRHMYILTDYGRKFLAACNETI
ncbi:protein of unknown function [Paenibacillus sp. CF095]|uniref:DUF4393 domain-containing protein n=1 Tax=Paenibacillus sp. CF095 TaxID=1881033 RepID=UPI00088B9C42|nr:DUF4393 domain-containing protein [Paenibacillus sp. CF095]SDC87474.1 protein of unknown function [Paenibacillus sp. CF095]